MNKKLNTINFIQYLTHILDRFYSNCKIYNSALMKMLVDTNTTIKKATPHILRNSNDLDTVRLILDLFARYIRLSIAGGAGSEQAVSPEQRNGEDESPYQKYLNPIFILTFGTIDRSVSHCEFILYVH